MQLFTKNGLYQPPAAGEPDHADPHFKPRLRGLRQVCQTV